MVWPGTICSVLHHGLLHDATDGQDAGIGRVDDGGELLDAEHAQVGDGEGVAFPVLRLQLFLLGPLGVVAHFNADGAQGLSIGKTHHGHQQAFFHRHGHADVDVLVETDLIAQPAAVHLRMLLQGNGHGFDHHVVEGDLVRRDARLLIASRTCMERDMSSSMVR
jgi:hypothetical protein